MENHAEKVSYNVKREFAYTVERLHVSNGATHKNSRPTFTEHNVKEQIEESKRRKKVLDSNVKSAIICRRW